MILAFLLASCIYDRAAMRPERGGEDEGGPAIEDLVPSGAEFAIWTDVSRIRGTAVARTAVRLGALDDEVTPALRRNGIEPIRDFERLVVAGRYEDEDWMAALEHRMDREKTRRFIDTIFTLSGETPVREVVGGHEIQRSDEVAVVTVRERVLAFVPRAGLPRLLGDLGAHGERSGLAARLRRAIARPRTEAPPFFVALAEDLPESRDLDEAGVPGLPPSSSVAAWAALDRGLEVEVDARLPDRATAERAGAALREAMDSEGRLRVFASVSGMEALVANTRLLVDGERLTLHLRLAERELEGVLARLELLVED